MSIDGEMNEAARSGDRPTRAVVVGGGSIGLRHLKNLVALAVADVAVVEPDGERRAKIAGEVPGCHALETLEAAIAWKPTVAVIATPPDLHVSQATALARAGVDLFVEKPLANQADDVDALIAEARAARLVTLVGCNMRFHPGPALVKKLIDEDAIGRVHFARVHCGSYLPEWRPWQDYRQSYSASAKAGGGVVLDCIHEIDLARWYLGPVASVTGVARHVSALEMDVEDVAMLIFTHRSGALSEVHLDYVQRAYDRGCQIAGERGTIAWDFVKGEVRVYEAAAKTWTPHSQPSTWQVNDMYVDELRHFLSCVRTREETTLPLAEAASVLRLALDAKRASSLRAAVDIAE